MDIIKRKPKSSRDESYSPNFHEESLFNRPVPEKPKIKNNPPPFPKKPKRKLLKKIIWIFLLFAFAYFAYFTWKIHAFSSTISIKSETPASFVSDTKTIISSIVSPSRKTLKGENEGRINILLLGAAGKGNPGQNLTDTIMILSVNTKEKKVALLSLPRDFYANIPETNYFTKINSIYQYGLSNNSGAEPIEKTVENITGLPIHYFLILDFSGFKKIIDTIGGVNIMVERDIYDASYPGPNYSYQTFEIKKGMHKMDGETALKYVRERHDDPEGDFGRAKRQQQVIQAVKNKVFSAGTLLNPFTLNNLITTLGESVQTNLQLDEIESLMALSKKIDTQNIGNSVVDAWKKDSLLKVSHVDYNGVRAFILVPRAGNFSEIQDLAQNIFNLDAVKKRQAEIAQENSNIILVNQSKDKNLAYKIKNFIQDRLNIKNVTIKMDDNNSLQSKSSIFDLTNGGKLFTLDELVKKISLKPTQSESDIINFRDSDTDFVILLGQDLEKSQAFEEDSVDEFNKIQDSQEYFNLIKN